MFVYYESINQLNKAYFIIVLICDGAYLSAWLVMQFFAPHMKMVRFDEVKKA